ncbi:MULTISPECIES: sugar kinase [Streptomyces]|uniref:Sugar kinase n=1 Tax=Streptomyces dengpaensis TaxID=2049881 RepID=A0ABM6SM64_9ACTN|nr:MULTISPECIES: sugar kinase [Streptomyces]AVH55732.1 sugar kinase [Streptomyces dengpaensis]PIB11991.1 sugar kinase [Streptomyces sp. HG99]
MTPSLPHQAPPPDEPDRKLEDPRHKFRRRAITLLIIVLLIGVPAGYLVISANQSRDAGKQKEEKYSATGLTAGWPSRVQRRLYQVPIPLKSTDVAYYETNNWKTSRLYVQFGTTNADLDRFLAKVGTSRDALRKGDVTIGARDQKVVGWEFTGPGPWWGLVHKQKDPAPTQDIVVNWSQPKHPMVYVVSRTIP